MKKLDEETVIMVKFLQLDAKLVCYVGHVLEEVKEKLRCVHWF